MLALYKIKRHPFPVTAHFEYSLVLTYALPAAVLRPLLAPGLELDIYRKSDGSEFGFIAIALVQTRNLRPAFLPRYCGQNFFLSGYRIFSRFSTRAGRRLRGLRILRSDTDKPFMAVAGNLLTHYNYRLAKVDATLGASTLDISVVTPQAEADLWVRADLSTPNAGHAPLPDNSPFPDLETARSFAGPLPFTFDYEAPTHSIVVIKGVRKKWNPQQVKVEVEKCTFFNRKEFENCAPILASAWHIRDIAYRWEAGRVEPLEK